MVKLFVCIAFVVVATFVAYHETTASPVSASEEALATRANQVCPARVSPNGAHRRSRSVVEYREMGGCNGGQGKYGTTVNKDRGEHSKNGEDVKRCLEKAATKETGPRIYPWDPPAHLKFGCYRETEGPCKCVVDSCFIINYQEVFQGGLSSFSVQTKGFLPNEAERYEDNMYLHYRCDRANEDISDEFEQ